MAYGYCPFCGGEVTSRERRINGDDTCENGHKYPSKKTLHEKPAIPSGLSFEHYKKFVTAGVSLANDTNRERLMLAGMGLGGEAGEVCDHAKKVAFHGKDMDREELVVEMGDVLWYFALLSDIYGITLDEVMVKNVHKLCDRYPHKHGTPEDVIAGRAT